MFGPWAARMVGSNNIKPINHTLQLQLSLTKYFATLLSCPCSGGRVLEKSEGIIRPQYKHHTKSTQMQQESISGQFPSHHIEFAKAKKSSCLIYRRSNKVVGPGLTLQFWAMNDVMEFFVRNHGYNTSQISPPLVLAVDALQHVQPAWRPLPSSVPVTQTPDQECVKRPTYFGQKTPDLTTF